MFCDFLTFLDDSNSKIDENTGEIIITVPVIQIEEKLTLNIPCKISSNCQTVIKCPLFYISTEFIYLTSLTFETTVMFENLLNISISNCTFLNSKVHFPNYDKYALSFSCCKHVVINNIQFINLINKIGIFNVNSNVIIENLLANNCESTNIVACSLGWLTIRNSQFNHLKSTAIFSNINSNVDISNCTFSEINDFIPIFIDSSKFVVKKCKFQNSSSGIHLSNNSCGVIDENNFIDIKNLGIGIIKSDILIKGNDFQSIKNAINADIDSAVTIIKNKLKNVSPNGVLINDSKYAEIDCIEIDGAEECGISISSTNKCVIKNSIIKNCGESSIEIYNNSDATIKNNKISNIAKFGLAAFTGGIIVAEQNQIDNIGESMVKLFYKGGGTFIDNNVSNCPKQSTFNNPSIFLFAKNGIFPSITNDQSCVKDSIIFEELKYNEDSLCLMCNKNKRNTYLLKCGHQAFCTECAEIALKNKGKCPICRFPISNISKNYDSNDKNCIICVEKIADCIILPCGHVCACSSCLKNWFKNKKICPICRKEVSSFQKVFIDF